VIPLQRPLRAAPGFAGCGGLAEAFKGSVDHLWDFDLHPGGGWFYANSGTHRGCLRRPQGTAIHLYLRKWEGAGEPCLENTLHCLEGWVNVAQNLNQDIGSKGEDVVYNGEPGSYHWRVESLEYGGDSYTGAFTRP
jgi:hypothetical protein